MIAPSDWIPIDERQPEIGQKVIGLWINAGIWGPKGAVEFMVATHVYKDTHVYFTHWMPFPCVPDGFQNYLEKITLTERLARKGESPRSSCPDCYSSPISGFQPCERHRAVNPG